MPKLQNSDLSSAINRAERTYKGENDRSRIALSTSFGLRQTYKLRANVPGYVYMWLNYGRKRIAFSTGLKAIPKKFDQDTGTIEGEPERTLQLRDMKHRAEIFATELKITGRPIDLHLIKAAVLGTYIETVPKLTECINLFNLRAILPLYETGELEKGSFDKLQVWNRHIERWTKAKLGQNARIDEVSPAEANHFLLWLKGKCNISHNVACRIVGHLKRILNYAVENEWIIRNPFMNYRKKLVKRKLDYLDEAEMEVLETARFASQALDQLRDIFLFQCYTSLSYNELRELTPSHYSVPNSLYHHLAKRNG